MGDPLLRLNPDKRHTLQAELSVLSAPWSSPPKESPIMEAIEEPVDLGTFEEYRQAHPEFFRD